MVNKDRIKQLKQGREKDGPVVYWMQRDQRVDDNWALIYAGQKAKENNSSLVVIFCLTDSFLGATLRHYDFMLHGLKEVEKKLYSLNIPFRLLKGKQEQVIPEYLHKINAAVLVSDFFPLRIVREWKKNVLSNLDIPYYTVDAHNIIPCWKTSDKEEFAAYTIRPKIHKLLPDYLEEFPKLSKQLNNTVDIEKTNWEKVRNDIIVDDSVTAVDWIKPGEKAAISMFKMFLDHKLEKYDSERNDPTKSAISNLSPYLHFGHISAQRIALDIKAANGNEESRKSFLEELIVRKELADNYCFYNKDYDSFEGFRDWAKDTLNAHRKDKREYIYGKEDFENSDTHDPLWNAAQIEMVRAGKMHGYMRMYWAKKILEWTKSPEEAIQIAIYLNDKYELDGRDPNGYTGIAWSIGGIHDRAWAERPIFGKIRYMNYNGSKRKFDVKKYIDEHLK